jgi:hypothetical protein
MAGSKNGLKEFEMVKRDQEYELFMIRNEDGKTYFTPALLRNIKMVCFEVGEEVSFEEDPLLRVRAMEDRDLQASAKQILLDCERVIEDFYKEAKHLEDVALAQYLSMAILALFLAANPRNLIQNTSGKSSLDYFQDFHQFIRRAMNSAEYQKFIAYPPDATDVVSHHLLHMTHFLCRAFFYRLGGVKQESIGLLHRCMRKGGEGNPKTILKGESIWSQFMIDDEQFRSLLKAFPNGPLFKILDLMQEEEVELMTFDPMLQGNLPQSVGFLEVKGKKIELLRMPSPTRQSMINKAALAEEFLGLLRAYGAYSPKKKHLIINLQDRTSWKEFARCSVLEKLQHNAEFCDQLVVMTLPKHTDFYYQNSEYLSVNDAEDFIEQFREQLRSSQECGFFFPTQLSKQEFMNFAEAAFSLIHAQVFNGQKNLTRRNREDFIEFFYQLLILKMIDTIQPDSISFSCKDAIDTGATSLGMFFGFVELLKGDIAAQIDYLRWLFYMPALFIRERAVDPERLTRILAALEQFDSALAKQDGTFVKALSSLYSAHLIKTLEVRHR